MIKEELDKELNRAEYRCAELKQYKKLFYNLEEIDCKLSCLDKLQIIYRLDVYKNMDNYFSIFDLSDSAQEQIKNIIIKDLQARGSRINQKIEEIKL